MPATPAWPPKSLPRLFVGGPLASGISVELDTGQANYLGNVMRLNEGGECYCSTAHPANGWPGSPTPARSA